MVNLGLIGRRLGHSFSKRFFETKFSRENIEGSYGLYELGDISEFPDFIATHPELDGLNVTIPYKESVIPYLDDISDDAREIGAVNVIKITRGLSGVSFLKGYNTDWEGFIISFEPIVSTDVCSALVFGTGGAAKAVGYALSSIGIAATYVSRNPRGKEEAIGYGDITKSMLERYHLIVNATPLGMYPDTASAPDIPYGDINDSHMCLDIVYNPGVTEFMRRCAENGAAVKNGLGMLISQAEQAWQIWQTQAAELD